MRLSVESKAESRQLLRNISNPHYYDEAGSSASRLGASVQAPRGGQRMSEDTKDTIVQVLTVVAVILTSILGRSAPRI